MKILIEDLKKDANKSEKIKMEAYMKNQFTFLGVKAPIRKEIEKQFWQRHKSDSVEEILKLAEEMYAENIREVQYGTRIILEKNILKMNFKQICQIIELGKIDPWWDNVDGLISVLKKYFKSHPEDVSLFVNKYYKNDSMWMRRAAIICQLGQKELTSEKYLKKAILANSHDTEFFIKKAIGWALREYSKTNPQYVREFMLKNQLQPLSVREGSKYI